MMAILGLLALVTGQAMAQTDTSVHLPVSYTTFQPPANQATYVDPTYGAKIQRVSDALHTPDASNGGMLQWIENEYSTAAAFNNDNSRFILLHNSYFGLYDGATGAFVSNLPFDIAGLSEPRWSRMDNDTLYYHPAGGNQLKTYNVATGVTTVLHTFKEYTSISGNGEMDMSYDGDHMVFAGDGRYIFLYTISTGTKSPVFDANGQPFDSMYVTPDNNVTVTWDQTGANQRYAGIEMFDSNMNFLRQVAHAGGHMHMSRDVNGDEVLIWFNAADPTPICNNAFVKIRLADASQTCLLSVDWSLAAHVSAADNTWAFVETYNPVDVMPPNGWYAYTNELIQIKLDGSEIRRLVQHRSRPFNSYNYMPKVSASRDGSRIVYSSNFGLQGQDGAPQQYSDTYVMLIPQSAASSNTGSTGSTNTGSTGTSTGSTGTSSGTSTGTSTGTSSGSTGTSSGSTSTTTSPANSTTAIKAVVNGASYQGALSPGSIVSIFGSGFANSTMTAASNVLPSFLGSLNVYFNGIPAPLYFASNGQINAQVPYEVAPGPVNIEVDGLQVVRLSATVAATAPGIFTTNGAGTGAGVVLRANDYQLVSQTTPTTAGAAILIYCTGLGAVATPVVDGNPAPAQPPTTVAAPQVTIGNVPAPVLYSGLAPGFAGLYQVNVQVPAGVPTGNAVPLVMTVNGASSNATTIVVQ
jgi:uncharacterized protein (TIGR03437 family)